jgi:hypothetical protein
MADRKEKSCALWWWRARVQMQVVLVVMADDHCHPGKRFHPGWN